MGKNQLIVTFVSVVIKKTDDHVVREIDKIWPDNDGATSDDVFNIVLTPHNMPTA